MTDSQIKQFLISVIGASAITSAPIGAWAQAAMPSSAPPPANQMSTAPPASSKPTSAADIKKWFEGYDRIRRAAQMPPEEKAKSDAILASGLTNFGKTEEKAPAKIILSKLVANYQRAADQLKQMPLYSETAQLHRGYYQYFNDARNLFADYLKIQDNIMAMDPATGKPIAVELLVRKQNLEMLDQANKALDQQLRTQSGIPPYKY